MALLEQSPWYQEIFSKGEELGEARGEARGELRGRREELYSGIELALEIKFGNQGSELMPIISQITDLQKLKAIQQAIKTVNTVNELQQILSTDLT